jgi:hypothetical protein
MISVVGHRLNNLSYNTISFNVPLYSVQAHKSILLYIPLNISIDFPVAGVNFMKQFSAEHYVQIKFKMVKCEFINIVWMLHRTIGHMKMPMLFN